MIGDLFFGGVVIGICKCPVPQGHHHSGPKQCLKSGRCGQHFLHVMVMSLKTHCFYSASALLSLLCKAGIKADVWKHCCHKAMEVTCIDRVNKGLGWQKDNGMHRAYDTCSYPDVLDLLETYLFIQAMTSLNDVEFHFDKVTPWSLPCPCTIRYCSFQSILSFNNVFCRLKVKWELCSTPSCLQ